MNIGILGGGIGGLSTAIALTQEGFKVSVYERHNEPSEIGAGIVCWPNASFVLEQLGVLDDVAKVSGEIVAMNRFSETGERLGSLDICALNELMAYPSYSIIRKDLMRILLQRCKDLKINVNYGYNAETLFDNKGKTSVRFTNGVVIQPDIVVGADGRMKSASREYVKGENTPIYQGFINWIGVYEQSDAEFSTLSVADYWGTGERFGIVPVSKNKAYWAGGVASKSIETLSPEAYKDELLSHFAHWPDNIAKIINETPLSRINKIYVHDHDPIDVWHKGSVVLLGDAAHSPLPTSGQGACQALEDAWHLTQALKEMSNKGKDLGAVYSAFTAQRKPKTTGITMGGRQLASSIFNENAAFCVQRNLASQNTDYHQAVIGMAKGWSSGLPLHG